MIGPAEIKALQDYPEDYMPTEIPSFSEDTREPPKEARQTSVLLMNPFPTHKKISAW